MSWINLVSWNGALKYSCDNLVNPSTPDWGSIICVSAPGEPWNVTSNNFSNSQVPHTGYASTIVDPPAGTVVAPNMTTRCGQWYTAGDMTCEQICLEYVVSSELFLSFNPSLSPSNYTASIQPGLTYCALATPDWNQTSTYTPPWGEPFHPDYPVSEDGYCGFAFNTTCEGSEFGDCCGLNGYCGSTIVTCKADRCNPYFGKCNEDNETLPELALVLLCGPKYGFMCFGNFWGPCCSIHGSCGDEANYCGVGACDPDYGDCWTVIPENVTSTGQVGV